MDKDIKCVELSDGSVYAIANKVVYNNKKYVQLLKIDDSDFVPISLEKIDELFEDEDYESNYVTAQDYVNYVLYVKNQSDEVDTRLEDSNRVKKFREDIPFVPRHDF